MSKRISKIENDVQDRNSVAWKKLCDYVDKVAMESQGVLLTHIAYLKGFWTINFGVDLIDKSGLSEIFGGYVIQTDIQGPVGIPKLPK
jgi:hypothetical protein